MVFSDLVFAKSAVAHKVSKQNFTFNPCTGRILHRHIAIIMKPSPPFLISDVVMVQGLLLIFLHSCEIKSGSGLGTKLVAGIP